MVNEALPLIQNSVGMIEGFGINIVLSKKLEFFSWSIKAVFVGHYYFLFPLQNKHIAIHLERQPYSNLDTCNKFNLEIYKKTVRIFT